MLSDVDASPLAHETPKPVWNIRLATGLVVSKILGTEEPTLENGRLKEGQRVVSGPYADLKLAITRERSDLWYPHLLRAAMFRGLIRKSGQHHQPTLEEIAEWTGFSVSVIQAWLKPLTSRSHRTMPRAAIRLILWEFKAHDENSRYDWNALLRKCR